MAPLRLILALTLIVGAQAAPFAQAGTGRVLSVGDYRSRAREICRATEISLNAVPTPRAQASVAPFLRSLIQVETQELQKLRKLRQPTSLTHGVTRGLADKQKEIGVMSALLPKANSGRLTLEGVLKAVLPLPDDVNVWKQVGVPVCQY